MLHIIYTQRNLGVRAEKPTEVRLFMYEEIFVSVEHVL
jgi:hypothetical protein